MCIGISMGSMIGVRMLAQRLVKLIELSKSWWPWHSGCHTAQILVSLTYKAKRVCNLLYKVFPLSAFDNRNFRRSICLFSICIVSYLLLSFLVLNRLTFLLVLPSLVRWYIWGQQTSLEEYFSTQHRISRHAYVC